MHMDAFFYKILVFPFVIYRIYVQKSLKCFYHKYAYACDHETG